jgi:hypothetical protein
MARYPRIGSSQASRSPTESAIFLVSRFRSGSSSTAILGANARLFPEWSTARPYKAKETDMLAKLAAHPFVVLIAGFSSTVLIILLL